MEQHFSIPSLPPQPSAPSASVKEPCPHGAALPLTPFTSQPFVPFSPSLNLPGFMVVAEFMEVMASLHLAGCQINPVAVFVIAQRQLISKLSCK